jgi:hypothetical protein
MTTKRRPSEGAERRLPCGQAHQSAGIRRAGPGDPRYANAAGKTVSQFILDSAYRAAEDAP